MRQEDQEAGAGARTASSRCGQWSSFSCRTGPTWTCSRRAASPGRSPRAPRPATAAASSSACAQPPRRREPGRGRAPWLLDGAALAAAWPHKRPLSTTWQCSRASRGLLLRARPIAHRRCEDLLELSQKKCCCCCCCCCCCLLLLPLRRWPAIQARLCSAGGFKRKSGVPTCR